MYSVNRDLITLYRSRYLYFHEVHIVMCLMHLMPCLNRLKGLGMISMNNPKGIPHYSAYDTKFFLALGRRVIQDFDLS